MKISKILLFMTVLVLLIGIVSATEVSKDNLSTHTKDISKDTASKDTTSVGKVQTTKSDDTTVIVDTKTKTDETLKNKTITKNQPKNEVKTDPQTYTINNYAEFHNNLTSRDYDTVILNINSSFNLGGNTEINEAIKYLTINGNGNKINGQKQFRFLIIPSVTSVTINNTNIENCSGKKGGAIYNFGYLTITHSNLTHNTVTLDSIGGGAIYNFGGTISITNSNLNYNYAKDNGGAIFNQEGTLSITNSHLNYNNATMGGGAIFNNYATLSITNSNLNYNTATMGGGAIFNNYATLSITNSNLNYNTAKRGGAISNHFANLSITNSNLTHNNATGTEEIQGGGAIENFGYDDIAYYNVTNSNFTENQAYNGAAIYCQNEYTNGNITFNNFIRNTADNDETLDLKGTRIVQDNIYDSTDISLEKINLTTQDGKTIYQYGENIIVNYTIQLTNSDYYDADILDKINKTLYIDTIENSTTKDKNCTISQLKPGNHTIYYKTCNSQSNTLTLTAIGDSNITTDKTAYDHIDGVKNKITLNITDSGEEKGTINITVKDQNEYQKLSNYYNVGNGYQLSTDTLVEELKNIYTDLNGPYTINITYISDNEYVNPSSTNFTLNIIKQRNTTIIYNILNNTEGNVKINITVLDTIFKTPIPDARIEVTGNITINTTSGVITDTSLKQGEYKITVKFNQTDDYLESEKTIDFNVEIDKDKKIDQLEEEVDELNDIIDEILRQYNTTITINPIQSSVGSIAKISADIIDSKGRPVTDGKVVFKINGVTLKDENKNVLYAPVSNGTASISYKVQGVWTRNSTTVQAVYGGSKKYFTSRTSASNFLNITKGTATITLNKTIITAKSGQKITLRAKVTDAYGDRITGDKVVFKLNGKSLTDENGNVLYAKVVDGDALLNYTIPPKFSAKTYTLTAVYGSSYYERTETNGQLVLEKKAVTINTDSITTKNKKTTIKATITDETGKLLVTSTKLAIKVNGKTILNGVNSTNGKINVSFTTTLRPGMYELIIISGENGIYKTGKTTTILTIQ